jgi:hypothetical protein
MRLTGSKGATHQWKFIRIGGVDQVVLRNGGDILHLDQLDQKLWVALACPTKNVEFDFRTLELLDFDKDGRIRVTEILEATQWVKSVFKDPNELFNGGDSVPLSSINDANPIGTEVLAGARRILKNLGKESATSITLSDVNDTTKIFFATKFNGDGVIPVESATDDWTRKVIEEIIAIYGPVTDRSGKPGINQAKLDQFMTEASAFIAWHEKAQQDSDIAPLGDKTTEAVESLNQVRSKVDDFFTRGRLAAFDPRSTAALNGPEANFLIIGAKTLNSKSEEIAQLPLAHVEGERPLPLKEGLNPAWRDRMADFTSKVIGPITGNDRAQLKEEEWLSLLNRFGPFEAWLAAKPATGAEKLGIARLKETVEQGAKEKISALIQQDAALEVASEQITAVEKLVRLQRDFVRLLNNFVSFSDFYGRRGAIFQAGTLYLDGRSCDLCVHVPDTAKHAALAGLAKTYLGYCDCNRVGFPKMTIAAAFTAGDSDQLMVGRNGVFYDRQGRDWDATITKIVDNPISMRQAFWAPYKKFVRMVEEQVAKRAAAADSAAQAQLSAAAAGLANVDQAGPPGAPPKTDPKKVDVGTVAALGVALGSLATFLGVMITKFIDLGWWIPAALIGLVLAVSGPSVLIAWLKLRQRNLGPILDANGWAVNGRMKINVPFGGALSKTPKLPPGSELQLTDPFAETHSLRDLLIVLFILIVILSAAWKLDFLNKFLHPKLQHKSVIELQVVPVKQ